MTDDSGTRATRSPILGAVGLRCPACLKPLSLLETGLRPRDGELDLVSVDYLCTNEACVRAVPPLPF